MNTEQNTHTPAYVITRMDRNTLRSVPIKGKAFDNLDAALDEAIRLNNFEKYQGQILMVDLASAYAAQVSA